MGQTHRHDCELLIGGTTDCWPRPLWCGLASWFPDRRVISSTSCFPFSGVCIGLSDDEGEDDKDKGFVGFIALWGSLLRTIISYGENIMSSSESTPVEVAHIKYWDTFIIVIDIVAIGVTRTRLSLTPTLKHIFVEADREPILLDMFFSHLFRLLVTGSFGQFRSRGTGLSELSSSSWHSPFPWSSLSYKGKGNFVIWHRRLRLIERAWP